MHKDFAYTFLLLVQLVALLIYASLQCVTFIPGLL
jgi:hypothetical protein